MIGVIIGIDGNRQLSTGKNDFFDIAPWIFFTDKSDTARWCKKVSLLQWCIQDLVAWNRMLLGICAGNDCSHTFREKKNIIVAAPVNSGE